MNIFLDTSSLLKLYHREEGTSELELLFSRNQITTVFLSEISKVEFSSALWKKVRTGEMTQADAEATIFSFESDADKYTFVVVDSIVIENAIRLLSKYGIIGLRTLDSIQLSTAVLLVDNSSVFLTSDEILKSLFKTEKLPTEIKN